MNKRKLSLVLVCCVLLAAPLFASGPRIVRLSFVQGDVRLDRNGGNGLEEAILNSPVPEGSRLVTGENSYAEVEFENGSTLRVTGAAELDFAQLAADSNGHLVSLVDVRQGTAYLNAKVEKHSQYSVALRGGPAVQLQRSSRVRFQVSEGQATVAVFDGEVSIPEREHQVSVKKGETLTLNFADTAQYAVAKNIEKVPADEWNHVRDGEHEVQFERAESSPSYGYTGYGGGDLLTYGAYSNVPGYGYMWQPYGVGPTWDPFGYGAWSYYPAWGWTFISPYPWGWAPYRYGSWYNVPGYGWMWQPGYGKVWNPIPVVVNPPGSFRPLHPPKPGPGPTTIVGTVPPSGIPPVGAASGTTVPSAQVPARRPEISRPARPHATHTPPRAVQMPADAVRETGPTPTPAAPAVTPVPVKPVPTAPSAAPVPATPVAPTPRPAPAAPVHTIPQSHTSSSAPVPHDSFSGGASHVSAGASSNVHK